MVEEKLFRYIRARVPTLPDAEDLMQETLLQCWLGADGFRGDCARETWEISIANNLIGNFYSKRGGHEQREGKRRRLYAAMEVQRQTDETCGYMPDYDISLICEEFLSQVTERQREVILERCYGKTFPEICKELDVGLEAAKSRYKEGIEKMRDFWRASQCTERVRNVWGVVWHAWQ